MITALLLNSTTKISQSFWIWLHCKSDQYLSWICAKVLMDFSRSEVIFATADFPLNQLFFEAPCRFLFFTWEHCFWGPCTISFSKIYHIMGLSCFRAISGMGWVWMGMGSLCGAIVWASLCDANNQALFQSTFLNFFSWLVKMKSGILETGSLIWETGRSTCLLCHPLVEMWRMFPWPSSEIASLIMVKNSWVK